MQACRAPPRAQAWAAAAGRSGRRARPPALCAASGGKDSQEGQEPPAPRGSAKPRRRRRRQQAEEPFSIEDLNPVTSERTRPQCTPRGWRFVVARAPPPPPPLRAADEQRAPPIQTRAVGRKSREVFDDVWTQLQRIGNPARSSQVTDRLRRVRQQRQGATMCGTQWPAHPALGWPFSQAPVMQCGETPARCRPPAPCTSPSRSSLVDTEFESPDAASTTVLVTGATGRVGRVLVRKLLLRGYKVRALVRQRDAAGGGTAGDGDGDAEAIPQSAELVYGDLGDYAACRRAVEGVDKASSGAGAVAPHGRGV